MTPDEEAEAYARIVYHLPWVREEAAPAEWVQRRDDEALRFWLVQRPVRVYVLLSRFCPQQLLAMLEAVWPDASQHLLDEPVLNAIDVRDAPSLFGRQAFAREAYAARVATIANLRNMVIHLWRTGGRQIVAGGKDFSTLVQVDRDALDVTEGCIDALILHALRYPHQRDDQIAAAARDEVVRDPMMMKKHTRAQIVAFAEASFTTIRVPEARRRAEASPLGQILADTEKAWRAKGLPSDEIAEARARLADTLLTPSK
jgi:hypothetical protein